MKDYARVRWYSNSGKSLIENILSSKIAISKVYTLKKRIGLPESYPMKVLVQALIDKTVVQNPQYSNEKLWSIGKVFGDFYVLEYIKCKYPRLPEEAVHGMQNGWMGSKALSQLATIWGLEVQRREEGLQESFGKVLAKRADPEMLRKPGEIYKDEAARRAILAILGGVYLHQVRNFYQCLLMFLQGFNDTKKFINDHILSKQLDPRTMLQLQWPRRQLSRLCKRLSLKEPVYRIIAETGRKSREPVFVIGAYSGHHLLGQGQASSLNLAEQQVCNCE